MTWKLYLGIFALALIAAILMAGFQAVPGYMDAEYYYGMGLRIANGKGLAEPFVWNYLTPVDSVPHPGFAYWMPLPAFLSALGIWITGLESFAGAKALHLLLAAGVPVLTMRVAWEVAGKVKAAVLAGCLAIFPAFYNVFWGTTDSFGLTMLLGGLFFLLASRAGGAWKFLALGCIAGLMHLTRADGLIWLAAGGYLALFEKKSKPLMALGVVAGYLAVMAPWFSRNLAVFGSLMPPGTSRTFWLSEYNDLFRYYPESLTFQNWVAQGWGAIVGTYRAAGFANIKNAFLVQGQVILSPLMAIGAWNSRRSRAVQALGIVWIGIFLLMSMVFPFAGLRGGFTHSGAAFQALLWAFAGSGFFTVVSWGVKNRGWVEEKAGTVFGSALVLLIVISSLFIFYDRVIGEDPERPLWDRSYQEAASIGEILGEVGAKAEDLVMINNPPGFFAATGRASIVIPKGSPDEVLLAGQAFEARYLVLEVNHPGELDDLYQNPDNYPQFDLLGTYGQAVVFRLPE